MVELSYSLHLGNDKNKSKKARKKAKFNQSGTTSLNNNSIQNLQQLSKVDKHNLRMRSVGLSVFFELIGSRKKSSTSISSQEMRAEISCPPPCAPLRKRLIGSPVASATCLPVVPVAHR